MAAPTLSMTMIARDEEATIGRVLFQASAFCDELIVVDTGSTDGTVGIAEAAGARVLSFPWIDDFAAARNHALEAATSDWVIWLDADDVVTREMQGAFSDLKESVLSEELDAVYVQYRYHFDETGACTLAFPRERLVRRASGARWVGVVHEVLDIPGSSILHRDDLYIEHRPAPTKQVTKAGRNLEILQKAIDSGDRTPRTRFYYARELKDNERYDDAYAAFADYLTEPESVWEQHSSLLGMAQCALALERPEDARARLYEALTLDPRRSEPFLVLGFLHFSKDEYAEALPWYAAATSLHRPGDGFTQPADYGFRPWDYLSVCLINTGRYAEGVAAAMRAIELGAPDVERLRKNAQWALDQLTPA